MSPNTIPCKLCGKVTVRHNGDTCGDCAFTPLTVCRLCGKPLSRPLYDGSRFVVHAHTLRWVCDTADLLAKRAAETK